MKKLTTDQWIKKAINVHGQKYCYDKSEYTRSTNKIVITCSKHGNFAQRASDHLSGNGCPECSGTKKWSTSEFVVRAKKVHGDKYDYSNSNYKGVHTKTEIVCPKHGSFQQSPGNHINKKAGCPKCAKETTAAIETKTTEQFIQDANIIHGNRYNYSKSNYIHSHTKVEIICKKHGSFFQAPNDHTNNKTGCPSCAFERNPLFTSKGEIELSDWIKALGVSIISNDRSIISPQELDIYIPEYNLAIEYCGLFWHSEQQGKDRHYHYNKYKLCKDQDIQLLTIFEDEWNFRKEQVKRKILSLLNKSKSPTIYARKTSCMVLTNNNKKQFLIDNHIQGNGHGSINYGLAYKKEIIAVMTFIKRGDTFELNRYATKYNVPGGFSKLVTHFQRNNNWREIKSFADLRWSNGNLYEVNGWTNDGIISPDYSYINNNKRVHKFNYRRIHLPKLLKNFDSKLSEWENCKNNNVLRIWDCGKIRYKIVNKKSDV